MSCKTRRKHIVAALLAMSAMTPVATLAQAVTSIPFPVHQALDENGVELETGVLQVSVGINIGTPASGLSYTRIYRGGLYTDGLTGQVTSSGSIYSVTFGALTEQFTAVGSGFVPTETNGSSLTHSGTTYTYTRANGTVMAFDDQSGIKSIRTRAGRQLSFFYTSQLVRVGTTNPPVYSTVWRLDHIEDTMGWLITPTYEAVNANNGVAQWQNMTKVALTSKQTACSGSCTPPSLSKSQVASPDTVFTDALGRTIRLQFSGGQIASIRSPGRTTSVSYTNGRVSSIVNNGITTTYSYSDNADLRTVSVIRAGQQASTFVFQISTGLLFQETNEVGRSTQYQYDSGKRLIQSTAAEGNAVVYSYDDRGNVTSVTYTAKPGSTTGNVTTQSTYAATCTNVFTCNSPITTVDPKGNVTDYSYDAVHGGVLSVTKPANADGVRAQTRLLYTQLDATGAPSASGLWVPTSTSICQTTSSCVGSADEVVTTTSYGSNFLPSQVKASSGDGSLSATTAFTYDGAGNVISVDAPLAGADDTSWFFYDAARQLTGAISADPDGTGLMSRRGSKYTYDLEGRLTQVQQGSVGSQTQYSLDHMTVLQGQSISYDVANRKVSDALTSATGVVQSLSEFSYDAAGRLQCVTRRMTSLTVGTDACSLKSQTASDLDRITRTSYDGAGRVLSVITGYGTTAASTVTTSYTTNGQVAGMADGNSNLTTFTYDGLDRLRRTTYPTVGGADYEEVVYDLSGNIISRRLRDGQLISYEFDSTNHLTRRRLPDSSDGVSGSADALYSYDLVDRLVSAKEAGQGTTWGFGYDALGRQVSETLPYYGSINSSYDLAGNKTKVTWPDGFYVSYQYFVTGEMSSVKENGTTLLASFTYDDLGRRTALIRGNGTKTTFAYDTASKLASIVHDLAGSTWDSTTTFTYNAVGQIATRSASNDLYSWAGHYNVSRSYSVNSLNQYSQSGSTALGYDARGNLSSSGSTTYGFNARNLLNRYPSGYIWYDPLDRIFEVSGESQRLIQSGDKVIAEFGTDSNLKRRYVWGDDEPLVWYEGAGLGDKRWLHADERGSIVAISNAAGQAVAINTYDEYGIPGAANQGRFQFTGQKWIPALGFYDFRARMYSPTLGRFLQPDPTGYADGLNIYGYVRADPLNKIDPTGLSEAEIIVTGSRYNGNSLDDLGVTTAFSTVRGDNGSMTTLPAASARGIQGSNVSVSRKGSVTSISASSSTNGSSGTATETNEFAGPSADEIVVTGWKAKSFGGARLDYNLPDYREQIWSIGAKNDVTYLGIHGGPINKGEVGESRVAAPRDRKAEVHTHPSWAMYKPGPEDYGHSVPVYGMAPSGVWVIRPGINKPEVLAGQRNVNAGN